MVNKENNKYADRVSRLVGWGHWFAFFNIIAIMLIGSRFIVDSSWPDTFIGQVYLAVSWVGHFGFLGFATYLLLLFPLTFIFPFKKLLRLYGVCLYTFALSLLLIDSQIYESMDMHVNPVVWEIIINNDASVLKGQIQYLFMLMPLIFLLELALSEWIWRKQRSLSRKRVGRVTAAIFFVAFIGSHLIYVWADAYFYDPVTKQRNNFPLSYPMTAKSFMEKYGLLDKDEYQKRLQENENKSAYINYPLDELRYNRRSNSLNVLLVSINNLRYDAVTEQQMPGLYQFGQTGQAFAHHFSSSNDRNGIFGLLYGIPTSYQKSIHLQNVPPVLLSELEKKDYAFSFFSGDNFEGDVINFSFDDHIKPNLISFDPSRATDAQVLDKWQQWVKGTNSPWFSFIELTSVDEFNKYRENHLAQTEALKDAYQSSLHQADNEIKTLIRAIESLDLFKNTVVIITSDHGVEFNESGTNAWGYGTNFSQYQTRVPMIIHWPGKLTNTFSQKTSHLDLSVTLLQDLLGVSSNTTDYSSGRNLFDESRRAWILVGNSNELALVTDNQTTVIDKGGNFKVYDQDYQRSDELNPPLSLLMQGLTELQRFYSKSN